MPARIWQRKYLIRKRINELHTKMLWLKFSENLHPLGHVWTILKTKLKFTPEPIISLMKWFLNFYATCNACLLFRVFNAFWWFFCQRIRPLTITPTLAHKLIIRPWSLDFYMDLHIFLLKIYYIWYVKITQIVHVLSIVCCKPNHIW